MPEAQERLSGGPLLAAISSEMVRMFRRFYGKGPTRARTVMVEDMVVCRMLDPFTTAERTLIDAGRGDDVRGMRGTFRQVMREEFADAVERLTGSKVLAFVSEVHFDPDMVVQVFFLDEHEAARDRMADEDQPDVTPAPSADARGRQAA